MMRTTAVDIPKALSPKAVWEGWEGWEVRLWGGIGVGGGVWV